MTAGGPAPYAGRPAARARRKPAPLSPPLPPASLAIGRQSAGAGGGRSDVPLSQWGLDGQRWVRVPQRGSRGPAPLPGPASPPLRAPAPLPGPPGSALGSPRGLRPAGPQPLPVGSEGPAPSPAAPVARACATALPAASPPFQRGLPGLQPPPSLPAAPRGRPPSVGFALSSRSLQLSPLRRAAAASPCPCSPGRGAHPLPTRGLCQRGQEGLRVPGAGWPPARAPGRSHPCPQEPGVWGTPAPCLRASASWAVADGKRGCCSRVGSR